MPKDTTKPKVPPFLLSLTLLPNILLFHSARPPKRPKRPPPATQSPKRTQRPPSVPFPPTCSSARTGVRESRPKTPMLALVKSASCSVPSGKICQMPRKRSRLLLLLLSLSNHVHPLPLKPYIDAAAADKARAEKDKAAYDASSRCFHSSWFNLLISSLFRNRVRRAQVQMKRKMKSDTLSLSLSLFPSLSLSLPPVSLCLYLALHVAPCFMHHHPPLPSWCTPLLMACSLPIILFFFVTECFCSLLTVGV